MRRWRVIAWLAWLAALGCGRSYHAEHAEPVRVPALNARLEGLSTGIGSVIVRLQAAGRAGVRLFDARLSPISAPPCSAGKSFARLESDGSEISEGPLDLGGSHQLRLAYSEAAGFPMLHTGAAVDLEIEEDRARSCVRLPLAEAPGAPVWTLLRGTRAALGSGFRVTPIPIHDPGNVAPEVASFVRGSAVSPAFAIWFEGAGSVGDGAGGRTTGNLLLASGVGFAPWYSEDWAFWIDAGYQAVWHLQDQVEGEPRGFRHFFHGLELAPRLGYAVWNIPHPPSLPSGATLHLELELPTTLWIGTGDAPRTTFFSGVGVGAVVVF